jgi:hypothetical protein
VKGLCRGTGREPADVLTLHPDFTCPVCQRRFAVLSDRSTLLPHRGLNKGHAQPDPDPPAHFAED